MSVAGIAAGVGAAATIGLGAANAAGAFSGSGPQNIQPWQEVAIMQAQINAELAAYPELAQLSAAAAGGLKTTAPGFTSRQVYTDPALTGMQSTVTNLTNQLANTPKAIPNPAQAGADILNPAWTTINNQLVQATQQLATAAQSVPNAATTTQYYDSNGNQVSPAQATIDFGGLSNADINNANTLKAAQGQLNVEQQYGPQLIQEALALQKQANPEGVAAREQEYQTIENQAAKQPTSIPLAQDLQDQLTQSVESGTQLTPELQRQITEASREAAAARGNLLGSAPQAAEAMNVGQAGINYQNQNQAKALAFLTSGATPADIGYRFNQQNIGNLASFLSGQTPQAQFGQLSGSVTGAAPAAAAPVTPYQSTPAPTGIITGAPGAAQGLINSNANAATYQGNPWLSGLSGILGGLNTLGGGGAGGSAFANLFNSPTGSVAAFAANNNAGDSTLMNPGFDSSQILSPTPPADLSTMYE